VGCTLHYRDINVTSALRPNKTARLCNPAWTSYVAFDKVACVRGSVSASFTGSSDSNIPETESMALVQMLKAVNAKVTMKWAKTFVTRSGHGLYHSTTGLATPSGVELDLYWGCTQCLASSLHVTFLKVAVSGSSEKPMSSHLTLNEHLVTALMNLTELEELMLTVGSGELMPQLGSLQSLQSLNIQHFCLRGHLPQQLLSDWHSIRFITVNGTRDFNGGDSNVPCGITGTLPTFRWGYKEDFGFDLSTNLLSGTLPVDLLAMGSRIYLKNNRLIGPIPRPGNSTEASPGNTTRATQLDLSDNLLEVHCLRAANST
jgi:hypothetical protein